MTGMIDRVAAALLAVDGGTWNITPGIEVDLARAAIAAMREPTEAMIDLGWDYGEDAWREMIDEALK